MRSRRWRKPLADIAWIVGRVSTRHRHDASKSRRIKIRPTVLQILVIRTRAAFRRDPVDDLVWVLDVAGLAVHAVGGIDLQAWASVVLDDFVDAGRTEARAR